jgi:filamentous hemagglutinin
VISSNQAAIDQNKNSLTMASLTYSQLINTDSYKASGFAMSGSVSGSFGDQTGASDKTKEKIKNARPAASGASAGIGNASGSQGSITQSGISGATLTITETRHRT